MFSGHFHVHDAGSPLDGSGDRNQLTYEAVHKGQTHLGCTNHGRLGTALEHIDACRNPNKYDNPRDPSQKRGKDETLIPILGMEAYWRPDRFDKNVDHTWANHLCLHARSLAGWRTLMRLSSKAWVKRENGGGHYGKPCIDWDMIEEDHEGIVVSTACMSSPVSQLILAGDESGARRWCTDMIDVVGEANFFFEIMPHDLDEQREINLGVISLAYDLGRPYMVTGDVHAPYLEWCQPYEDGMPSNHLAIMMASTRQTITKRERKKDAGEDVYGGEVETIYLSSAEELAEMFEQHHPDMTADMVQEGLDNTEVFAKHFAPGFVIGKTTKLPKVSKSPKDSERIVRQWCLEGMDRVEGQYLSLADLDFPDEPNGQLRMAKHAARMDEYRRRLDYEFDVLKRKGVLDYFVLVGDMVRWAKSTDPLPGDDGPKKPIRVGLGRGSAAGSLVSYLIGITAIDPTSYGWDLLFERFLNPDRVGLPDIDLDFESRRRSEVKEYLARKYGHDHVADIIAYQTFAPRAVIKTFSDVADLDYKRVDKVTESIGDLERDLVKIAAKNEIVSDFAEEFPWVWEQCLRAEDQIKSDSRHAGGVLVTPKPVNWYMPTQLGNDDKTIVTAWSDRADFPVVSDYGFVKIDVLGVSGLEKQQLCVDLIEEHYGEVVEPNDLPVLRNPYSSSQKVIDSFVHGLTAGVFQFGGRGITQLLRHIRPTNAVDIAVANALYRPGPIQEAFKYGDRKNGKTPESEWYWHDAVEPLLKQTYGIIAFQEQVMAITKILGNFSGGDADSMRKAISKLYRLPGDKAREFMEGWRQQWLQGCLDNGLDDKAAVTIWEAILEFAGYGFNKSHSASYALQAYQDMHLKVFYPLAFYASVLTVEKKDKKKEQEQFLRTVLREARVFDVEVQPPDVNRSEAGWSIDGDKIRYGLVSINGMGSAAVEQLIEPRPFEDFTDYVERIPSDFGVNNSVALAKAGALDDVVGDLLGREYLLTKVRQWPETTRKFNLKMGCGCKKTRTVKAETVEELDDIVDDVIESITCEKHKNGEKKEIKELDPYYTVIEAVKAKGLARLDDALDDTRIVPTESDLVEYESEVLNVPLSLGNVMVKLHDFLGKRVYSEAELDKIPAKPNRKGKAHGMYCSCKDCNAAQVVVGGEVVGIKEIVTKKTKEKMAFVDVSFDVNTYSCTFFPASWRRFRDVVHLPTALLIAGHKDQKNSIQVYDCTDAVEVWREVELEDAQGRADAIAERGGPKMLVIPGTAGHPGASKPKVKPKPKLKIRSKVA